MAQEVSIRIKINDNFKDVTVDAASLGKAIDQVTDSSKELSSTFVKFASISQIAENAASAIGQLHGVFKGLTDAYAAQSVAETRLAQAMSNTMGATDQEVQAIKDLCSAQQQLGVIGDEVQLAAAQELATYLEYSDSLKAIIPVMNDMAAQQYGLGASAESVTQIATMLGKVMNGQTEALSRYGYKFDEAQKQILQFGTEAERAAVLVDVVGESVGGMNEALAKTPAGRMQQVSNTLGDWKEKLGSILQGVMPVVTGFNALGQTITTVTKLKAAFAALNLETIKAKVQSAGLAVSHKAQSVAARMLGISEIAAATATGALRVKIIALQATMTMGLSLAITAVIDLIVKLTGKSRDAADAVDEVDEATEAFSDTSKTARSEIALYQVQLEDIIKHHKNDAQTVEELNQKYGESFGYYNTAATWYKVLTEKSAAYCKQLGYEAQARVYASQIAALQLEKDENDAAARNLAASGGVWRRGFFQNHMTKEAKAIVAESQRISEAIAVAQGKFDACTRGMLAAQEELRTGMDETSAVAGWEEMSLTQLTKAIQDQKGVVESLAGVDEKQAAVENRLLKQMEARKKLLEGRYGLGSGSSGNKNEYDGSKLIENASSYKELGNNIKYYQNALEKVKPTETELISQYQEEIRVLQAKQAELKAVLDAAGIPTEYKTVNDVTKAISYQQALRKDATADKIAGIDEEIRHLEELKALYEVGLSGDVSDNGQIKTYEQLEAVLSIYQNRLKAASDDERDGIQQRIVSLEELKKEWDDVLALVAKPGDIGTLDTFEELDEAISYYQTRMNKATADEIADIQKVILALQAKRRMLETTAALGGITQPEGGGFNPFSAEQSELEMTLAVRVQGADIARQQIENLQKMLTVARGEEKKAVEDAIKYWSKYANVQVDAKTKGEGAAQALNAISSVMGQVSGAVEGSVGDWLAWGSQVLSSIAQVIPQLISLATANTAVAATGAASSVASIPYVGWIMAGAAALGLVATLASIPKFAEGGVAFSPTLGVFGEAGPEAIIPLDRFPELIASAIGFNEADDEPFRLVVRGDDLEYVMKRRANRLRRG